MPSPVHFISAAIRFHAQISCLHLNQLGRISVKMRSNRISSFFLLFVSAQFGCYRCSQQIMDLQSQTECCSSSTPPSEYKYLCLWNCSLSWHTQAINMSAPHWEWRTRLYIRHLHRDGKRCGWGRGGSSFTGQTISERGRGSVTYCFTAKLPDLLGVKARSSLVYTQPWISAWNMSTSSQPISHRGGAVWAADTSRFPWTMRPIPHGCPLSETWGAQSQT